MQWLVLFPYVLIGAAWILVPGLAIGLAARLRGWLLLGLTPVLSVFVIAASAIFGGFAGIKWGPVTVLIFTVITAGLTVVVDVIRRRGTPFAARRLAFFPRLFGATASPIAKREWRLRGNLSRVVVAGLPVVLAGLIATWQFVKMTGAPAMFSQTWDNIYHLSHIRSILDTFNGSSLADGTFYPSAWHDIAALINMTLHTSSVVYSTNATAWLTVALIWPLGCICLLRALLPGRSLTMQLAMGILASSFAAFPSLLIGFGVLYPNVLGLSLLPGLLVVAAMVLRLLPRPAQTPPTSLLVVTGLGLVGMALAHPNAVLTYIACLAPMGLMWAWHGWRDRARRCYRGAAYWVTAGVALVACAGVWVLAHITSAWGPRNSWTKSLYQIVVAAPIENRAFWLLGVLIVVGLVVAIRATAVRWWLGPVAAGIVLWLAASAMPASPLRSLLVGGFYADAYRLAAVLGIVLLPLVAIGLDWIWALARAFLASHTVPWVRWTAGALVCLILIAGVQLTGAMTRHLSWVNKTFQINPDSALLDSDEYALLQQLPGLIPPGVRVATYPGNGSSLAYALFDVPTTTQALRYQPTPDEATIEASLNQASTMAAVVCPALHNLGVGYVLDFGDKTLSTSAPPPFPGFQNLATAPGFTMIAQVGQAALYRIDACQ